MTSESMGASAAVGAFISLVAAGILTLMIVLSLLLSGCTYRLSEGRVIDKSYIPAHSYTYTSVILVGKVPIFQTHMGYASDSWSITIEGLDPKGRTVTNSINVSKTYYDSIAVGNIVRRTR
jgi:hypothetical protein